MTGAQAGRGVGSRALRRGLSVIDVYTAAGTFGDPHQFAYDPARVAASTTLFGRGALRNGYRVEDEVGSLHLGHVPCGR